MLIYNTLTRQKEEFRTIHENKVSMYVCGPTVYNYIHVGNARPLVFFDTVRRYLEYKDYDVKMVMNLTDIDDKIINRAIEENVDFSEISDKYSKVFFENAKELNVDISKVIYPKATDYINKMIEFISSLQKKGAAYDTDTTVYFNVEKAKDYGKLSKKDIKSLDLGSRVDVDEQKNNPMDFALWKKQKSENEPAWDSPWGKGRPGWHIECSTMAKSVLGDTIDIHGGGEDLQFPHHENEIAQSETLHEKPFANYWMHNSMITIDKEKMSKSKGNFFTLHDIEKEFDLLIVRIWLLSSHYRSPLDYSFESLNSIKNSYQRLKNTHENLESLISILKDKNENKDISAEVLESVNEFISKFEQSMDDDLNTSNALTTLFEFSRYINSNYNDKSNYSNLVYVYDIFNKLSDVLGIKYEKDILDEEIEKLINERTQARKDKNYKRADEIRDLLKSKGIELKDTSNGVTWSKI